MPLLRDPNIVRTILNRDRPWAAYILGDLVPGSLEHCSFYSTELLDGIVVIYRGLGFPILYWQNAHPTLLDEFDEPAVFLNLRLEDAGFIAGRYTFVEPKRMGRFLLDPAHWKPVPIQSAKQLSKADLPAIQKLYADAAEGEQPYFFYPEMLQHGVFHGIWENGALVAVAGTHQVTRQDSVAAVGNVYTRRDRRQKGLAAEATSAVVSHLLAMPIATIVLNVEHDKPNARRLYERLGFKLHCEFLEGRAVRQVF